MQQESPNTATATANSGPRARRVLLPGATGTIRRAAKAELARIGQCRATESMLLLDPATGRYDAEATPGRAAIPCSRFTAASSKAASRSSAAITPYSEIQKKRVKRLLFNPFTPLLSHKILEML